MKRVLFLSCFSISMCFGMEKIEYEGMTLQEIENIEKELPADHLDEGTMSKMVIQKTSITEKSENKADRSTTPRTIKQ